MTTTDTKYGWDELMRLFSGAGALEFDVEVGFFEPLEATKAAANDLGLANHRETAFVRQAFDANRQANEAQVKRLLGLVLDRKITMRRAGEEIGRTHQAQIRQSIDRHGLIDTGDMRRAVAFRSRRGGGS